MTARLSPGWKERRLRRARRIAQRDKIQLREALKIAGPELKREDRERKTERKQMLRAEAAAKARQRWQAQQEAERNKELRRQLRLGARAAKALGYRSD